MFCIEEISSAMQSIALTVRSDRWTIVVCNTVNGVTSSDVEASCASAGSHFTRTVTICSTMKRSGEIDTSHYDRHNAIGHVVVFSP